MLTRAGCEARKLIASATSSGASQSIWSLVLSSHSCAPASVTWLCSSVSTMPGSIAETRTFFAPSSASPDPVLRPRQTRRLRQTRRPRRSGPTFKPRASQGIPQTHRGRLPSAQLHEPARRPGHQLRQPHPARPRHAGVHHVAHPAATAPSNSSASPTDTARRSQYPTSTRPQNPRSPPQPVNKPGGTSG